MRAVLPRWSQSGTDTDNLRDPEALPTIVDAQMPFPRCHKSQDPFATCLGPILKNRGWIHGSTWKNLENQLQRLHWPLPAEGRARRVPPVELCVDKAWFGEHSSGWQENRDLWSRVVRGISSLDTLLMWRDSWRHWVLRALKATGL